MKEKYIEIVIRDPVAELRQAKIIARWKNRYERERAKSKVLLYVAAILAAALIAVAMEYHNTITERDPSVATPMPMGDIVDAVTLLDRDTYPEPTTELEPAEDWEATVSATNGASLYSNAVPLDFEHQGYLRTYCEKYACPFAMALAVADWETRGTFDMAKIGQAGEVGIMQLNPGQEGKYHDDLEIATGLDPTTPEGNIAAGCYLIGQYLERYGDPEKVAMAYNMGEAGAKRAWSAGIFSTDYSAGVMEALEKWRGLIDA